MICAAYFGRERVLTRLLSCPEVMPWDVDTPLVADVLHRGKTALHIACLKQFGPGVAILLTKGLADPTARVSGWVGGLWV